MKTPKSKVFRTIEELDMYLQNNERANGYLSLEVTSQVLGGRMLCSLLNSKRIHPVEVVNEYGRKEAVFRNSEVKNIALKMF